MRQALVPIAILLAGIGIAIAVYVVRAGSVSIPPEGDLSLMRPVSPEEHIFGNPDAKVYVVEYADIDSPYAKQFQETMQQIMAEEGEDGDVAWVFRHFPLVHIYPDSGTHAHAAECAASLAGEQAFWLFISAMHADAPGNAHFRTSDYATLLPRFGVAPAAFDACMEGSAFEGRIGEDAANALQIGATGSPYLVILGEGAEPVPVTGALPYDAMKAVIAETLRAR
jgi:protein-disulfide isomerase